MLRGTETDEVLLGHYQEGSEEAFKILYARHSGKVLGYLRSRANSEQQAMDLFQEVFVKIHKSKHLYNRSLPALPWIFSVTYSVLVDGKRSEARKKEDFDYDLSQVPSETEDQSQITAVTPLMAQLPENQRAAIHMRYMDEKTFEEIADTLKTSPLNVRKLVSRGIHNLKEFVKEEKSHESKRR